MSIDKNLLACRPHTPPAGPPGLVEMFYGLPTIDETYRDSNCETCGAPVWIGPRQQNVMTMNPEDFAIACYSCAAAIMQLANTLNPNTFSIHSLGGQ